MHLLRVVFRRLNGVVDDLENIRPDEIPLTQHSHAGAITIQDVTVQHHLLQLDLGQLHQPLDLVLGSVVVFDAERINGNDFDAAFVTYFENLTEMRRLLVVKTDTGQQLRRTDPSKGLEP